MLVMLRRVGLEALTFLGGCLKNMSVLMGKCKCPVLRVLLKNLGVG
jgi:hypothetical protein